MPKTITDCRSKTRSCQKGLISLFLLLLFLLGCGYHTEGKEKIAVSIPYVIGDEEGELTDALVWALSRTPNFTYAYDEGNWILKAKILRNDHDRIGYKFDRDPKSGKLRDNLVGIENRRTISVEVCVVSAATGKNIIGPQIIKTDVNYDYDDPNSLVDLSFIDLDRARQTSIAFSLGQLDSVAAAGRDASTPLFRLMAQKIIDGMIATGDLDAD